ncbi:MAG: M20/M25/M40 family metallo-hydrolase [Parashewanella sp.]
MKNLSLLSSAALLFTASTYVMASDIPLAPIMQDVAYLANDNLKGRASFTPEADKAADYIASRFKEVGLSPFKSNSYKQTFPVFVRELESVTVSLNKTAVKAADIAVATTSDETDWETNSNIKVSLVNAKDDLRSALSKLNQQGGDHLVLINSAHKKLFNRYRAYFSHPKTKLVDNDAGTLVMVLTDEIEANNFAVSVKSRSTQKQLTNVIGVLPAKNKQAEMVLFSAHYDHIGTKSAENSKQDIISNGADDDASGVSGIINLAKYFSAKQQNTRQLVFVAFAAEEIGGYGSKYFAQQQDPSQITAMFNLEMIGKPSKFGQGKVWMTGYERSDLGSIMNRALKPLNTKVYADPYPKQRLFYRSDNATLARLGVPAHSFSSTQIDKDPHYHKVTDEIATLDFVSMQQVVNTIAKGVEPIVTGQATPKRIDVSKVTQKGKIF